MVAFVIEQGVFLFEKCLYILLRHNGKKGCFQIFDLRTTSFLFHLLELFAIATLSES